MFKLADSTAYLGWTRHAEWKFSCCRFICKIRDLSRSVDEIIKIKNH